MTGPRRPTEPIDVGTISRRAAVMAQVFVESVTQEAKQVGNEVWAAQSAAALTLLMEQCVAGIAVIRGSNAALGAVTAMDVYARTFHMPGVVPAPVTPHPQEPTP